MENQCWTSHKIKGKIVEAKFLKSLDYQCIIRINSNSLTEFKTLNTTAENPFWSEDFEFQLDGYQQLSVTVYDKQQPVGRLVFYHDQPTNMDWYLLKPLEQELNSRVRIILKLLDSHVIVTVVQLNLPVETNCCCYIHLLPDQLAETTQMTRTVQDDNPFFNETFIFQTSQSPQFIHVLVYDPAADQFLGSCKIPISTDLRRLGLSDQWYPITNFTVQNEKRRIESSHDDEKKCRARELIRNLAKPEGYIAKNHEYVEKMNFGTCGMCKSNLVGGLSCTECGFNCHLKCKEACPPMCGGVGVIRIKIVKTDTLVLPFESYQPLIEVLSEANFTIPLLLGQSQDREEIAKLLIRVYDNNQRAEEFVKCMLTHEIKNAKDTQTLFRGNSMASKALDIYMKFVAGDYLKLLLEPVIKLIVLNKQSCELDILRLDEKTLEKQAVIEKNYERLVYYTDLITSTIFKSVEKIPNQLCLIFQLISDKVKLRFPDDNTTIYTGVSGFLFLRFFVPAILSPKLFGMEIGATETKSRTLTLISKALQNLANLVEFGQKEPFMHVVNPWIQLQLPKMKTFLEEASKTRKVVNVKPKQVTDVQAARDCSDLVLILAPITPKLDQGLVSVQKLSAIIRQLDMDAQLYGQALEVLPEQLGIPVTAVEQLTVEIEPVDINLQWYLLECKPFEAFAVTKTVVEARNSIKLLDTSQKVPSSPTLGPSSPLPLELTEEARPNEESPGSPKLSSNRTSFAGMSILTKPLKRRESKIGTVFQKLFENSSASSPASPSGSTNQIPLIAPNASDKRIDQMGFSESLFAEKLFRNKSTRIGKRSSDEETPITRHRSSAGQIVCRSCMQKITDDKVVILGLKHYHPTHFKCTACQKDLGSGGCLSYDIGGKILCQPCLFVEYKQ